MLCLLGILISSSVLCLVNTLQERKQQSDDLKSCLKRIERLPSLCFGAFMKQAWWPADRLACTRVVTCMMANMSVSSAYSSFPCEHCHLGHGERIRDGLYGLWYACRYSWMLPCCSSRCMAACVMCSLCVCVCVRAVCLYVCRCAPPVL